MLPGHQAFFGLSPHGVRESHKRAPLPGRCDPACGVSARRIRLAMIVSADHGWKTVQAQRGCRPQPPGPLAREGHVAGVRGPGDAYGEIIVGLMVPLCRVWYKALI